MFQLDRLTSLVKKRKRIGRGGARGGTSGRGNKGQKARSGAHIGSIFEGGQMPLSRRLPKRGFNNVNFRTEYDVIGLGRLEEVFESGTTITKELLVEKRLLADAPSKGKRLYKVLGGTLTKKLIVHADAFSKSAEKAIQDCGGQAIIKER